MKFHTKTLVVNNAALSSQQETIQDLLSILHVFRCSLYGVRNKFESSSKPEVLRIPNEAQCEMQRKRHRTENCRYMVSVEQNMPSLRKSESRSETIGQSIQMSALRSSHRQRPECGAQSERCESVCGCILKASIHMYRWLVGNLRLWTVHRTCE